MLPKFKYFYKPVLEVIAEKGACPKVLVVEKVCPKLNLTKADASEMTASGRNIVYDRVTWAITYLKRAGMIASEGYRPAYYSITEQGRMLLSRNYEVIDNWILGQLSEDFAKYQYIPKGIKCAKRTL